MTFGAGKYDDALTLARQHCGSNAAILIVVNGESGAGFSVQAPVDVLVKLPQILRNVADTIADDLARRQN